MRRILGVKKGMFRASLQILIITWWIGAGIACLAIIIHKHSEYAVVGTIGWTITITSTALIVYEIKKIKEENKELMENDRK